MGTLEIVARKRPRRHRRPTQLEESYENVAQRARTALALLQRYAEAESMVDRGGSCVELEQDAWFAVQQLLRKVSADVERLKTEIENGGKS